MWWYTRHREDYILCFEVIRLPIKLSQSDQEYLNALKAARIAILTGAQSYKIGSRALTKVDIRFIVDEIARLEGATQPRVRRVVPVD